MARPDSLWGDAMPGRGLHGRNDLLRRCVSAVTDKDGDTSREGVSRAFAICTASLQRKGYMKPGTDKLTGKGAARTREKRKEPENAEKMRRYELVLKAAKESDTVFGMLARLVD